MRFAVINPLGSALVHYVGELRHVLETARSPVSESSILEPSASGGSRLSWLVSYVRAVRQSRRRSDRLVVSWPVLGYLDAVILRLFYGSGWSLVIHDPDPLVFAVGYGRLARLLCRLAVGSNRLIVHSRAAQVLVEAVVPARSVDVLPHPMLAPTSSDRDPAAAPAIRVLGQYKADRDIELLESLGRSSVNVDLEIIGRGWPPVAGWSVRAEYLSEAELSEAISSSSAVLIPYRRFFQSGIAVRCLESCVPVIGPADSSLSELLGGDSAYLAGPDAGHWLAAIRRALGSTRSEFLPIAAARHDETRASWAAWADARREGLVVR